MTAIIVQARMGSTRLPGKVLRLIAGKPMFAYQLERLRRVRNASHIVVATTTNATDRAIVDFCEGGQVACVRGSESDVLSRYFEAAERFNAGSIVRITADCPLIDPDLIELAIDTYTQAGGRYDYVSNMIEPTWPYGMAVEVFSFEALADAHREAKDPGEREHVTPFIYWRPQRYAIHSLKMSRDLSHLRWTVDTPEDFELVSRLLTALKPGQTKLEDVLALLGQHPDWSSINDHVKQKAVVPQEEL